MSSLMDIGVKRNSLWKAVPKYFQVHTRLKKTKVPKVLNTQRALDYFDIAYPPVYGTRWPSIRLALLSKPKYLSVVNNFADNQKVIEKFQSLGAVDIRSRYLAGIEQLKPALEKLKNGEKVSEEDEDNLVMVKKSELPETLRPSLIKLTDDELAARSNAREIQRYPEEYRRRSHSHGEIELDPSNRVIKASQMGNEAALMMDYVPSTKLKGLEDWVEETDVFVDATHDDDDIGLKKETQIEPLELPESLKIYSFLKGDISDFPHPKTDPTLGVLDHYPLNGSSLLPVLALGIKPGDRVLDLCAAPGGKSFIALQTCYPELLVCNDVKINRVKRIENIMKQYIPTGLSEVAEMIRITTGNGCELADREAYDKVLVDVPCINDRHSLKEHDDNIFTTRRVKERMHLPAIQSQLLVRALQAVRPGGCVVYSTCTLSPLQNDGAVHLALAKIWQETTIESSVVDMTYAVKPLNFLYRFGNNLGLRYGQIVLPSLLNNFGPMYICKIKRLK